ncbi:MAG: hypothetical protein H6737_11625 [Alphaproteobacteria bacterium]|nr:hypothetical protein [Alphaproteobacteria bacterium]
MIVLLAACAPTPLYPVLGEPVTVVPSPGLPPEIVPNNANNNLDVEEHDGRLWMAFRSAPTHFADTEVDLWVMSTADQVTWEYEGHFRYGIDLREPQLVSYGGELHLFFATLGSDPLDFEPGTPLHSLYVSRGDWTTPGPVFSRGFIPWRIKVVNDRMEVTGYDGGENVYEFADREPIQIRWLQSTNGLDWSPVVPGKSVVLEGGGSETDVEYLEDGSIVAVVRNEAGGPEGFGSFVCTAPADDLGTWSCDTDPKKYDSPLLFQHNGEVWLVARRNVTDSGAYDLERDDLTLEQQYLQYQADYWGKPKRCSLWRVDPETRTTEFAADLASKGDTCFPEVVRSGVTFRIFNYTSPLDSAGDPFWLQGQTGPTHIVYQDLELVKERFLDE